MSESEYEVSSGNVFADLGFAEPEEELARAALAHRIATIIEDRGLTQAEAAAIMGVNQPKVSELVRGRLEGFSLGAPGPLPYRAGPRRGDRRVPGTRRRAPARSRGRLGARSIDLHFIGTSPYKASGGRSS